MQDKELLRLAQKSFKHFCKMSEDVRMMTKTKDNLRIVKSIGLKGSRIK
jgi:hypothetical protein